MTTDSLGAAKLDIIVDTADFEIAINRAKNAASGFGSAAEQAFAKSEGVQQRAAKSLLTYVANLGKTADQTRLLRAAGAGVDPEIIAAAASAMQKYQQSIELTANEARELAAQQQRIAAGDAAWEALERSQSEFIANLQRMKSELSTTETQFDRLRASAAQIGLGDNINAEINQLERLKIEADQAAAAVRRIADGDAAWAKMEAEQANFIRYLQNLEKTAGKTHYEILELQAAELGLSNTATPLIERLKQQTQQFNAGGLSAKQYAAALRGVPAQITDIVVSLQGGMNPLTVFLQQGGQLKDMFGGVVPAARALGGAVAGLINPFTVSAALLGSLAIAAYKGSKEIDALNAALIQTGNSAGFTGSQLAALASNLSDITSSTTGAAANALAEAAASGRLFGEQLNIAAKAALDWNVATGRATKETIADFVEIAKDPVAAVTKLNETQHFLTLEIYEQIKALQDQGRQQEAATLAMEEYGRVTEERTESVRQNLGTLETAWRNVGAGAKWAWDRMMDIGREGSLDQTIQDTAKEVADLQEALRGARTGGMRQTVIDEQVKRIEEAKTRLRGLLRDQQKELQTAAQEQARSLANSQGIAIQSQIDAAASNAEKRKTAEIAANKQVDEAVKNAQIAGEYAKAAEIESKRAQFIAAAKKKYEDKSKGSTSLISADRNSDLQELRDALKLEQQAIETNRQEVTRQYDLKQITIEEYYGQLRTLAQQGTDAEVAALQKQMAVLRESNTSGRDAIQVRKQIGQVEAQLALVRGEGAQAQAKLNAEEVRSVNQRRDALDTYRAAMEASTIAMERNMALQVLKVGMGDREFEIQTKINEVYAKQADELANLSRQLSAGKIDRGYYDAQVAILQETTDKQVSTIVSGYDMLREAQGNWLNGANAAIQNYQDRNMDIAGNIQGVWENAFEGMGDAVAAWVDNGKLEIDSLFKSIFSQLAKLAANRLFSQFIGNFVGGGTQIGGVQREAIPLTYSAKGNVFSGPSISAFSNSIVDKPTFFAKGGNVMGEAGPEAIMPLKRDSQGRLGVSTTGANGSPNVNITMIGAPEGVQTNVSQGQNGDLNIEMLFDQFDGMLAGRVGQRSSKTGAAMKSVYGLREQV